MDQQVYSCCHNFLTVTQSYNSKNTPIGKFHAVKIAKSVFLYVFTMAFPTSPLLLKSDLKKLVACTVRALEIAKEAGYFHFFVLLSNLF